MSETTAHATRPESAASIRLPATILGVGLGGFVDGIVLHQVLQWHPSPRAGRGRRGKRLTSPSRHVSSRTHGVPPTHVLRAEWNTTGATTPRRHPWRSTEGGGDGWAGRCQGLSSAAISAASSSDVRPSVTTVAVATSA
nr:DUF2243 domain-containing protein [Micromonospora purpureochromogenes]